MEFEFTDTLYVSVYDLREMCRLCKKRGYTPQEAFRDVSLGWDDADYYKADLVADQVIAEIQRRLDESNNAKKINKGDK